jgi:polysaccharide export outer membrane protein
MSKNCRRQNKSEAVHTAEDRFPWLSLLNDKPKKHQTNIIMKKSNHQWLWTVTAAFALAIQSPAQEAAPAPGEAPTGMVADAATQNYRLAQNDLIYVKVFQEDDLNSTLRISEDGTVIFPLIGSVKVGGKTVQAATKQIRDLLDARFLVNPQVSVTVLGYANRSITVLGQVQKPGSYSLKDQDSIDLLQAVGLAGGFTRLANPSKITIKRTFNGSQTVMVLDGKRMAQDQKTAPFFLLPGDTVTVAESLF